MIAASVGVDYRERNGIRPARTGFVSEQGSEPGSSSYPSLPSPALEHMVELPHNAHIYSVATPIINPLTLCLYHTILPHPNLAPCNPHRSIHHKVQHPSPDRPLHQPLGPPQTQSLLNMLSTRSPNGPQKSFPLARPCSSMNNT